jgi:hypothetical protein
MKKPVCSLSLDLDNEWSYLKTHGDARWETLPSYLDIVVPRVLEFLDHRGWKITFFIVGQDAELEKNHAALKLISAEGHEVGNHSFHHEPWLHTYTTERTRVEIERAERAIENATGFRPFGFRGPGYSFSATTFKVLSERGYLYDASTLPTYLGPLARAYYLLKSDLSTDERRKRKQLFGRFREGLRPVKPYYWKLANSEILEIPVTTMPLFKLPFHFSYLLYLGTVSFALSIQYFRIALHLCRISRTEPSLLLHPLDFLGSDDVRSLSFFPAMSVSSGRKLASMARYFDELANRFEVASVIQHARHIASVTGRRRSCAIG